MAALQITAVGVRGGGRVAHCPTFNPQAIQSYVTVDGAKVLALAFTSPVMLPPSRVPRPVLKLLRSVHRGIDFLL